MHLRNRKAPMARLIQKLGLRQFRNVGPLIPELLATDKVGIKLKQHIGAPCEPVVAAGDRVSKGQVLGRPPTGTASLRLGAPVHASIDGTVTSISGGVIWIQQSSRHTPRAVRHAALAAADPRNNQHVKR